MSEIEQVDQLRTAGKTVAKACKQVGISVPTYYAQRRSANGAQSEPERPVVHVTIDTGLRDLAANQYFAIRHAILALDRGDAASARNILATALTT